MASAAFSAGRPRRLKAGSRLRLFGSGPARHPCGGPFGSVSRQTIYRVNCPSGASRSINSAGRGAVMQEIEQSLEKLGMSEYAQRFAENGIDLGVLPDLTDQDLKEIGVLLGHRRKLLRAIADLGSAGAAEHVPAPASAAPVTAPTSAPAEASGERRHVTVMFCDLVVTRDYRGYARRSGWPFCRAKFL